MKEKTFFNKEMPSYFYLCHCAACAIPHVANWYVTAPTICRPGHGLLVFRLSIRNSQASYELNGQELFADVVHCLFQLLQFRTREVGSLAIDLIAIDTLVEPCA